MPEPLPNELLMRIFSCVEASDYASAIRMSCWSYHRDLNVRSRGWAIKRVSFDIHTCRLVCRKWNRLALPMVFSQVNLSPTRASSFSDLLSESSSASMALCVKSLTLNQYPIDAVVGNLQLLLPLLHSLQELKVARPARVNDAEDPVTVTIPPPGSTLPGLERFTVLDATLDERSIEGLSHCLRLFSSVDTLHMSDVSFVGDVGRKTARTFHPVLTAHVRNLILDSTNPLIARDTLRQANCVYLPSEMSVRLAHNPTWMSALTDLFSLYSGAENGKQSRLLDLTLTVEPFGYYSPLLQVDIDTDAQALTSFCDALETANRFLQRMKFELHVYDGDHINPRKLALILRLIGTLPPSLDHLVLDVTYLPDQLWQALAVACSRLDKLKVVEVAVHRRRAKFRGVHPAAKWLDDEGILRLYDS